VPAAEAARAVDPDSGPRTVAQESDVEVLVIEDDPAAAELLNTYLRSAGYAATVTGTGEVGLATARQRTPDAILLDVRLPGMDGWAVLRELKRDECLRHIPVVIISVIEEHDVGVAPGAVDYFVKPISREALLSWLVRHGLVPPLRGDEIAVLAIDDEPATLAMIERHLRQQGLQVVCANGGVEGLKLARERTFDLVISDLIMPDLDGFSLIAALHDDPRTRDVPVLVLTGHDLTESDKARLNGKITAVMAKGDGMPDTISQVIDMVNEVTGRLSSTRA
jgi:CheY-like chemotaxis protein